MRARRRIVILAVCAAVGAAVVCSVLQPDRYTATSELLVSQPSGRVEFDPQTGVRQDLSREVRVQADALAGQEVADRVRDLIGAAPGVTATPRPRADVIVVTATAPSLAEARTIADAYVRAYLDVRQAAASVRLAAVLDGAQQQYRQVSARLAALPAQPTGSVSAQQRALLVQQDALRQQIDEAQVTGGSRSTGAYSLGPASGSTKPTSPKPVLSAILATIAGGVIGLGGVAVAEVADDTVRGRHDLRGAASRLPVIAEIPHLRGRDLIFDQAEDPAAEAFRRMRTALPFVARDGPPSVILVTSPGPSEGKSTVALNLAAAVAASGRRACLVMCDLRRPGLRDLDLDPDVGFCSVALGDDLGQALQALPDRPRLYVLPPGPIPPNPAEVLESATADSIFERLRQEFDVLVIDSAPVLPVTDAALLARRVDLTVVVVAAGRTTRTHLERAVDLLDQISPSVGAVALNHAATEPWLAGARQEPAN